MGKSELGQGQGWLGRGSCWNPIRWTGGPSEVRWAQDLQEEKGKAGHRGLENRSQVGPGDSQGHTDTEVVRRV